MTDTAAAPEAPKKTTLTVTLDGTAIEANPGELLIAAAERHGTFIPRFCWHPRMKEVGMCRMCLVEVSGPRGMSLQPACMQPCAEGMVVDTKSEIVKKAQDGVLEFLLVNHPLDCPVCDKGGECPLQDQTLTFGPGESRFVEEKRHYEKPIAISELVLLDRERCILCDRCTRFSKEVAGDPLIHFINRGNTTEVNTFPEDPFSSYFSGNVVQICPVGALTAEPYRFAARPWDLDQVESTCTSCAVGCKTVIQSSGDQITRFQGVDSDPVNWGWLCDKGRFGYEAVSTDSRIGGPFMRDAKGSLQPATWIDSLDAVATRLRTYQPNQIGFIGGARLTNEDQYAWVKLAKNVLRTDNVDAQLSDGLPPTAWLGLPNATIDEMAKASLIVSLGPDLKEELPVLFLRLRDAVSNKRTPFVEFSPVATGLTSIANASLQYRPGEVSVLVEAVLDAVAGKPAERQISGLEPSAINEFAAVIAKATTSGKGSGQVVVLLGRASLADSTDSVVEAASRLMAALPNVAFLPTLRRANLRGALDLGMSPGLLPGRVSQTDGRSWYAGHWSSTPSSVGLDTVGMLEAAAAGELKALVLLGADLLADVPDQNLVERALAKLDLLVAVDSIVNDTNSRAHIVLGANGFAEKNGTTTNLEGRVTPVAAKVSGPGTARPDWMIAAMLSSQLGTDLGFETVEQITDEIGQVSPAHLGLSTAALRTRPNVDGILLPIPQPEPEVESADASDAAASDATSDAVEAPMSTPAPSVPNLVSFRKASTAAVIPTPDSYSLRLVVSRTLYDDAVHTQNSASLAKLAPPAGVRLNPGEVERHGLRPGGSVKVLSQTGDLITTVIADERVPRGVAHFFHNQSGVAISALMDQSAMRADGITKVRLETVGG
jgi:NADH-quinone oxidoreductase subunit G